MEYYNQLPAWNTSKSSGLGSVEEEEEEMQLSLTASLPLIPQPMTPKEPMEFLSRSWSISAEEISRALASKHKHFLLERHPITTVHESVASPPHVVDRVMGSAHSRRMGGIGKWFQHKDSNHGSMKKKDRARAENAHMHAAVSVAGLAAALAAVSAAEDTSSASKMTRALASATELLASRCIEMAEQAGADHDRVASMVRSSVDVRSPGDLMTLTAAAATALRAEAALKSRLPKEPKRNATISPCDRSLTDVQSVDSLMSEIEDPSPPCVGDLLQHTRKGALRWKRITVYINKKSQVMIKLKSKHVGGAFSKKDKCMVYAVSDEISAWPLKNKARENTDTYFGLRTGQGFLEFKCKSKIHKQQWVDGVRSLLYQVGDSEGDLEHSFGRLDISSKRR